MDELRLLVHQTAPFLGEVEENRREILRRAAVSGGAGLLVFPELALTGYTLRGRAQELALPLDGPLPLSLPQGTPPLALGLPERGADQLVYNAALLLHEDKVLLRHRKVYLPTYGPFEEGRYFARGREGPGVAVLPSGWRVGILICEDFWHPALLYLLAMQAVDLILVLAAAPGRGEPEGRASSLHPPLFRSWETWSLLARTAAIQYAVYLVVANRAGVEEGATFAGGSLVVAPGGEVLAQGPQGEEAVVEAVLRPRELRRARTPFAHLRDEDPAFLGRALQRLLREG